MNIKNFCDNMTKNNFRKLSNDDQMLLYKVALFCVQNNLGIPWKARYIINKFYESYNCSFGMGCKQIEDFDESKPYGEHDYMTMEECVSKCSMPSEVLDLMVSKIDPNDKLKYIKANPKYVLEKMKQGDLSTLGITYDFTYPITDVDIRWVTKIVLNMGKAELDREYWSPYIDPENLEDLNYLKPFSNLQIILPPSKYEYPKIEISEINLEMFPNVTELELLSIGDVDNSDLDIKYPPKLEKIHISIVSFRHSISRIPDTVKMIKITGNLENMEDHHDESHHGSFLYNYFNDLPNSLELLDVEIQVNSSLGEIILPKNTKQCLFRGLFSFKTLKLNDNLEYLNIDIVGESLDYAELIIENDDEFFPQTFTPMKIIVPKKLLSNVQITSELEKIQHEKIDPRIYEQIWSIQIFTNVKEELLGNKYQIEVI